MTILNRPEYLCDVCTKTRSSDANRWWLLLVTDFGDAPMLTMTKWNDVTAANKGVHHACGEQHALELVSRFMATGSLDPCTCQQWLGGKLIGGMDCKVHGVELK